MKEMIDLLLDGSDADLWLAKMLMAIEENQFDAAMYCQFLFLISSEAAREGLDKISPKNFNELMKWTRIAQHGK